ncbi:MAG: MBL fold metallo-hydrolase [Candidatus Delongbacteria bacterium]|nr:MBL fold metallo-hydrolase [Candidatus Delongbacteria bacterium]
MGVIITHGHHDHIDGAGIIVRKMKIPVYIHKDNFLCVIS